MKKVYIIHGYGGYPDKNWFPWLKAELEKLGVEVTVPAMPHTSAPQFSEWLAHIQSVIAHPDTDTYLVGHSLGCITILQYLNNMSDTTGQIQIGGAVLVAGFAKPIHFTELNSFFTVSLDEAKIKERAGTLVAINSDNDEHVPTWQAHEIKERFGAELIMVEKGGHLNHKSGYTQFNLLLGKLKEMMGL